MILLGIGSNLPSIFGDRFKNINLSISNLELYKINIINKSSYYETPSYPNKKNPKFINVIIQIDTPLDPSALASSIISIEEKLKRKRVGKNEPRTCDIDIIDFNGKCLNFKFKNLDFTVPHKKLIYRNFVLFPLKEIAPNWIHPKTHESINSLIDKLTIEDKNSILKIKKP